MTLRSYSTGFHIIEQPRMNLSVSQATKELLLSKLPGRVSPLAPGLFLCASAAVTGAIVTI
jgi:hypothetical protein